MTRRFNSRRIGNTTIKTLEKQPIKFAQAICPLNVEEQKERFLKHGKLPKFVLKGSEEEIEDLFNKARNQIRFDLFGEAEYILKTVKQKYGDGDDYLTAQFGEKISKEEATHILEQYLRENNLDGAMSIVWCADLASSARMMWIGPHCKHNKPEARSYSFWIKNSTDNNFLREQGIRCLADHEIGTHFVRAYNDGFQPWYSNRKRFSLRGSAMTTLPAIRSEEGLAALNTIMNSRFRSFNDGLQPWYSDRKRFDLLSLSSLEELRAEEGLAAINTILNAKARYMWGPALLYYTACKAAELTFKQLFDHLSIYVRSPEHRWRLCMRVKRGLLDPNDLGGYGKDQCYFEGAVEILRSLDMIDFNVMMSGKICVDEVQRCKRLARLDCLKLPAFMKNEIRYKKHLKAIAQLNGLDLQHQKRNAPAAYVRRLKQGRRIGDKVRRIRRRRFKVGKAGSPLESHSTESTSSEYDDYSYFSSDYGEGGGNVDYTPVSKFKGAQKDPRVDSGFASDIHNTNHIETVDTLSLRSLDTTSLKSMASATDEKNSTVSEFPWKSGKSLKTDGSGLVGNSGYSCSSAKSDRSGKSSASEKSADSKRAACHSSTTQKPVLAYSSVKSRTPVIKNDSMIQKEKNLPKCDLHNTDNFSFNNNARRSPRRKDLLPPLSPPAEEQVHLSSLEHVNFYKQPLPSPFNHNVCTTIVESDRGHKDKSEINEKGDYRKYRTSRNEEVILQTDPIDNNVSFSDLTNSGMIRTKSKSANQNSVFQYVLDEKLLGSGHNFVEYGPEKFIYPDFSSDFEAEFLKHRTSFLTPSKASVEYESTYIPKRRAKSAYCKRTKNSSDNCV